MAKHSTAHHEKQSHGKIAAGRLDGRERPPHVEYHDADSGDSAQPVERVKDTPSGIATVPLPSQAMQ
jgi:hypothetical protein